jgi:hypothetical protein
MRMPQSKEGQGLFREFRRALARVQGVPPEAVATTSLSTLKPADLAADMRRRHGLTSVPPTVGKVDLAADMRRRHGMPGREG